MLLLPADIPAVDAAALERVLAAGDAAGRPSVVLVPDRHGRGTNALLLDPPDVIDPAFGGDSRAGHAWLASSADAAYAEVLDVLGLDVDTPEDLLLAEAAAPEASMSTDDGGARVEVIALAGLPEIHEGDDLEGMIGDALEATPGALPAQPGDVLVVTQKVVSKAEGAVVDLRTVEPSPQAIEWATAWDRDARQIEVVLREASRIVRMERGVLITETRHGFVCANGGIDASNVGPDSGDAVTLLPVDPDASAARIRDALRARFGTDLPSSSRTASGGRGAGASSTSRSACPASSRSRTSAASPTPTAGSCARRSARWPTSWPPRPSSRWARPPAGRSRSSGAPTRRSARAPIRDVVMAAENDLFR